MRSIGCSPRRPVAVRATALLGTALSLLGALPARGQGGVPSVALRQLARVPRRPWHGVTIDYQLPPGFTLVAPYVRVTDAGGNVIELLPGSIVPGPSGPAGYRELHSQNYRPGVYQVRAEVRYLNPAGQRVTLSSPPVTLTIPGP